MSILCDNVPEKNRGGFTPKPEEDRSLKNAIGDLKTWTLGLRQVEEVKTLTK